MNNITKAVAIMIVISIFICAAAIAENGTSASSLKQEKSPVIDAGNKVCPVLGGAVDGMDYYEYKGKRYGLCCSMCKASFASDPEKFAAIAEKEAAGKK